MDDEKMNDEKMDPEKEMAGEYSQSTELSSMAITPKQPRLKKKVVIEEEPQSHDQASLVVKDGPADPKPKRPVLDEPVIVLLGREVLFAIGVFFLLALVVSLVVIQLTTITKLRKATNAEEGCKGDALACRTEFEAAKTTEARLNGDLRRAKAELRDSDARMKALHVRLDRVNCSSPHCLRAAFDLLDKMDYGARPCDDFWRYSCGEWLDRTERTKIPRSRDAWGLDAEAERQFAQRVIADLEDTTMRSRTSTAERKYKTLFQICMNRAMKGNVTSVGDYDDDEDDNDEAFDRIGRILSGWTTCLNATHHHSRRARGSAIALTSSALDSDCRRTRQKILEELLVTYAIDAFVRLTVTRSDQTSSRINVIKIDQGGLALPDRSHYLGRNSQHSIPEYRRYISETMKRIWNKETSNTAIHHFARSVINVEKQIAQLQQMADDTEENSRERNLQNLGTILTIGKLQEISPEIDWLSLVHGLWNRTNNETKVFVESEEYVSDISNLLLNTTNSDLHNYFTWRLVFSLIPVVSKTMKNEQMAFINALRGKSTKHLNGLSRQRYCQEIVTDGFLHAVVSSVVFREDNMQQVISNVTDMVVSIKEALLESVLEADWMDNETSTEAQQKLSDMKIAVAFPEFVLNETELDRYYSSYVINVSEDCFENILNGLKHRSEMMRLRLEYPGDIYDEEWDEASPLQPKVFYLPDGNTLGVTASLLQKPFYDQNRYVYVNYGSLGTMIAHEMTSVLLDLENRRLVPNWWSEESSSNFKNRTQCLKDNYSQRHADFQGIGRLTFAEHFSDISALVHSYQAYNRWEELNGEESLLPGLNLTNDQVFFVAFAQNLCKARRNRMDKRKRYVMTDGSPAEEFRVRESLSLSNDFREAFNCEISSADNATVAPQCDQIPW